MENQQEINSLSNQTSKGKSLIKSLSILVVDDDTTCLSIVAAILKSWKHQVVTMKNPNDALEALKVRERSFDLVITDVHMPDMDGFELQQKIDQDFQLPVVLMSADEYHGVMIKGLQNGASFFIAKPVSPDDLKNLWQYAYANKKGKVVIEELEPTQESSELEKPCQENTVILKTIPPISDQENRTEFKKPTKEEAEDGNSKTIRQRKRKFMWSTSLHNKFVEAVRSLGLDKAVPKKILEVMNVEGLTREHVASHLQKYRIFVKRVSESSSKAQLHQIQPGQGSNMFSRRYSYGGYFPMTKSPKLGISSSFYPKQSFSDNSTPSFINNIPNLFNKRNSSRQSIFASSISFPDTNNSVFQNKLNVPFYGDHSKKVVIGQEKPQIALNGINNSNINMPSFENIESFNNDRPSSQKIGAFNSRNFNFDPNIGGLDKVGSFRNNGLDGSTNFVSGNGVMNEMNMSTISTFGGSGGDSLPNLGVSSANNRNQPVFEATPQLQNNHNNGLDDLIVFGQLENISDSRSNYLPRQFGDQGDVIFTGMDQTNFQSQTQIQQPHGAEELISNSGIATNPLQDNSFQHFDPNSFQIQQPRAAEELISNPANNRNQPVFEATLQLQNNHNNGLDDLTVFGQLEDISDSRDNYLPRQFGDQGDVIFTGMDQINFQSQTQIQQPRAAEELISNPGTAKNPLQDNSFQPFDPNSFQIQQPRTVKDLISNPGTATNPLQDNSSQPFDPDSYQIDEDEFLQSLMSSLEDDADCHSEIF